MTKEEYNKRIDRELTPTEIALLNFCIYYNPKHIEYYQNYHMGQYDWCYNYLMNNRKELNIKNVPIGRRSIAKRAIQSAKEIFSS